MHHDSDLRNALEPEQLSAAVMRPYPRRKLSGGVLALLVGLRIFILLAIPVVIYAFIHALLTAHS
jgi:hypothetical protein